jgi:pimeloyl-ACP methyl ester carboxylesterase
VNIAYREAGDPASQKLVLLDGFPASSHQYRNLIPALADRFHVISPDYPEFGNSDMPERKRRSDDPWPNHGGGRFVLNPLPCVASITSALGDLRCRRGNIAYAGYFFRSASINGSMVNGNSNGIVCGASHTVSLHC